MINHTRTLLSGLPGQGFVTGEGEEYSPPDYQPPILSLPLQAVRGVLFGPAPDRRAILYRLRQFMAILDATPLTADVTAIDSRRTDAGERPLAGGFELAPSITVIPQGHTFPLAIVGDGPSINAAGQLERTWTVDIIPST